MTDKNKHIPQGYKDSSLGIIPKEWEVKRLGDFCISFSGGTPRSGTPSYYNGTIPFIRSGEINQDKTELFLSQEGLENSSAKFVQKGDILYALYGANSGQCSLSKINGVINQAILCIRPNAHPYFLMSVLQFNKNHYYNSYLQGGQGNLSGEIVSNYKIALPSTEEQERICSVLQLWDIAIEKQSELIEKLKLRKRALMQQLLTGKKRLPGFSGEWKEVQLGCMVDFSTKTIKTISISKDKYVGTENMLSYCNGITAFDKDIPYSQIREYKVGDILMSNIRPYLKKIWLANCVGGCSTDIHVIRNKNSNLIDTLFLYYCLTLDSFFDYAMSGAKGSKMPRGDSKMLRKFPIALPDINEQKSIIVILQNADKEITLANEKLASLQSQKRGLMQQLLTGKKRI